MYSDAMNKKSVFKIGSSAAASWAWGTSLIMGQQIAQQKGIIAWVMWAVCNTLTLALFGLLYRNKFITKEFCEKRIVRYVALIIQLFCLLVQLNFIDKQFRILTGNANISYIITAIIGIVFVLLVFKKGLPTSIRTDVFQWLVAVVSIIIIIMVGLFTHAQIQHFATTSGSGILWGIWSGLILFAGPIGDVQHWQRAEEDKSQKAYFVGSILFGLYMLLILGMAFFEFTPAMNIILLIAVLCVTTSTIDSIAVALHEVGNKTIGTIVALLMCVMWGLFVKMGMIEMWSSFGVIRFAFAVFILTLPFALKGKLAVSIPATTVALSIMSVFAVLKDIDITSVFGILSFVIATLLLVYLVYLSIRGFVKNKGVEYENNQS